MTTNKKIFLIFFILLSVIFCYFRLKPIYLQTVPYTYDQGRDFLKAQEIIRDKNLTFIGPTTGLQGIFHGAWWYYFLAIPYLLFQGNPSGFVVFIFISSLLQFLLFSFFLKKKFNIYASLLFATIIASSPYFIGRSTFAINSIMTFPFILLFFYSVYRFFEDKHNKYLFLIFLSMGFVFEAEVPFGVFIIPSFLFSIIILRQFGDFFPNLKSVFYAVLGLIIPLVPRLLFELKNNFAELKIILGFLLHPKVYTVNTFSNRILERTNLFKAYYTSLFPDENILLALGGVFMVIVGLIIGYRKFTSIKKSFLSIMFLTFIFLYVLSLFYKDTFWPNYYEGLSYFYALFLALGIYGFSKKKFNNKLLNYFPMIFIIIITFFGINMLIKDARSTNNNQITGMKTQITAIETIYGEVGNNELCVRIYTPPVITYTYNYLFSYYSTQGDRKYPSGDFIDGECYFIMEKEQEGEGYQERIVIWREANTPEGATLVKKKIINENVTLELWRL